MTLQEWHNNNDVVIARHCHARCVPSNCVNRSQLFHLDDYFVSSVTGGTIWMVRTKSFSDKENAIRDKVRNSCEGKSLIQLDCYMNENEGFERDCIEEFLMEAKAKQRETPAG